MKQGMVLLAGLALALSLNACATGGGGSSLSARVDRHEQQIQGLLSQVGQVEQVLPGQAEMWSQMQTMRQEINMLNGKIDDLQRDGSGDGSGELARLRDKIGRLETLVRQMASQLAVNVDILNVSDTGVYYPPPAPVSQSQPAAPVISGGQRASVPAADTARTPQSVYDAGIKSFDQRRYKDAVASFKNFSASYPKHNLASNAHFWEGESYFQLKDYPRAALAYQEVIANFPGSSKLQSAMLKQGIALYHAGKKPAAQERLQDLIKRYPNSPEASRAKQFIAANK